MTNPVSGRCEVFGMNQDGPNNMRIVLNGSIEYPAFWAIFTKDDTTIGIGNDSNIVMARGSSSGSGAVPSNQTASSDVSSDQSVLNSSDVSTIQESSTGTGNLAFTIRRRCLENL